MHEILNTVLGDNFDADIDLRYERIFYNGISDCDNETLIIPIVTTLYEDFASPMIVDENAIDHIPKHPPTAVEILFILKVLLFVLIVVHSGGGFGRKK